MGALGRMSAMTAEDNFRKRRKTICDRFRAGAGLKGMDAGREEEGRRCPLDFRGHLQPFITLSTPYALRMQSHALIMRFSAKVEKPMKSRAEQTSEEPYALYAPLLGVGPFSAFSLLRELHTVHTADDGIGLQPYCL